MTLYCMSASDSASVMVALGNTSLGTRYTSMRCSSCAQTSNETRLSPIAARSRRTATSERSELHNALMTTVHSIRMSRSAFDCSRSSVVAVVGSSPSLDSASLSPDPRCASAMSGSSLTAASTAAASTPPGRMCERSMSASTYSCMTVTDINDH